ncbi:MAG: hypothetical protein ACSHW7_09910 [Patiriisocius sp.]|uniref:hypothetical protein n=1 Tax=Patiriisocius sp. TaxID=2822396 RepID=UPI003EF15740
MRAFNEEQKFRQWWLIAIAVVTFGFIIYSTVSDLSEFQKSSSTLLSLILTNVIALAVLFLIFFLSLNTEINEKGISYGFWPFQLKLKYIPWSEISKIYVRQYRPIAEYGGWGYRFSKGKHGKAYNVSGSTGIQIIFKNGKKTLIGTQKKNEVESVLKTYQHKLHSNENTH